MDVKVEWPGSGSVQTFKNLRANQLFKIKENKEPVNISLRSIKFKSENTIQHNHHEKNAYRKNLSQIDKL